MQTTAETILAEFAIEKRIPVKEKDVPKVVKNALISIEDYRFYDHIGIDPYRLSGAIYKNLTSGSREGASTITQQLTKNLFLTRDQTYTRKFNEWMMALEIERFYTKSQILEMYMNYVFLGAGAYGFEAGAKNLFCKDLKRLEFGRSRYVSCDSQITFPVFANTEYKKRRRYDETLFSTKWLSMVI